ncbi:hypothetical protein [Oceanibacterium hippocampi]|uniref:Uncharacterized protein n=1 Tax=Oceanibacterium hippocampi TaxID=745714 RepID=A0A1Y5T9H6_9PROT|nr:hypothetical protein [Oceanibacterium hippocampi]SLN58711.1 hypothetical protein OCH7691_02580 [Oceanibacterium hippocampi]
MKAANGKWLILGALLIAVAGLALWPGEVQALAERLSASVEGGYLRVLLDGAGGILGCF